MVTKICWIITLACLGASLAVAYLKVEPRIKTAEADAADKGKKLTDETEAKQKVQADLDKTKADLATTTTDRDNFKAASEKSAGEAQAAKSQADEAVNKLSGVTQEFEKFKNDHDEFTKLNMKAAEIVKMKADLGKTTTERDTFKAENAVLALDIKKKEVIIASQRPRGAPPQLPDGLKGKVVAVDPRYQFVVLNIGLKQGVKLYGELVINRGGKLIGKVEVTQVEPDLSIGSVLQKWKGKEEIGEGDEVAVATPMAKQ